MTTELDKQYDPAAIEPEVSRRWLEAKAFAAAPDGREHRYVVMMPLPNVTGALHMGHAMDNVMQDLLVRWHRMQGDNTLWMAGTDHAGIATQSVVEKRLKEVEGRTRHDLGRAELVRRIWAWKDQYQARIVQQQQAMGCSCDWDRQRFTMDAVCSRAVRHTFFRMFRDGLIYQGARLVNWDCHLQTAVADDELYKEVVQGHFYYLRYPVVDRKPGEPEHVVVATTRPETMLGDTAVAVHPDPAAGLGAAIAAAEEKLAAAPAREKRDAKAELERLRAREQSHLPTLVKVAAMARDGRKVLLPLQEREIPLVLDEWARPEMGTGCVKITPAHDPNDYEVWQRHRDEIGIVNVLAPDGTINKDGGAYCGLDRFAARKKVMDDLEPRGLVERVEEREIEVDHSDRSKTIVEPWLSKQWFVRMGDVEGGVVMGRGTGKEFTAPGLAQAAIDAASGEWRSATGRNLSFHPDPDRYRRVYEAWLREKRDWCISRQLWWGHRIPVWRGTVGRADLLGLESALVPWMGREDVSAWLIAADGRRMDPRTAFATLKEDPSLEGLEVQVCFLDEHQDEQMGPLLRGGGLQLDPDVLDTWFSSALWPHSTLGWPDPRTAKVDEGQSPLGPVDGRPDCLSYYYPGSCLVTARDIITLWVARMVITGLYNVGDVPFTDVFIHATVLDGKGERMSKSKGNGIDPMDIIDRYGADALRYVVCELQTGTQDIRLPVQAISPFSEEERLIDLAAAKLGPRLGTYVDPDTGRTFDLVGTYDDLPQAKAISERFEVGGNFCNKLWNAARFAFLNLEGTEFEPRAESELEPEDRWILSRLAHCTERVQQALLDYNPSAAVTAARGFFWGELCDWYLEMVKPRIVDPARAPVARQVLAAAMDQVLRLLHPFVPFVTEKLWQKLNELAPRRGVQRELPPSDLLVLARWPEADPAWRDAGLEATFDVMRQVVTAVRETRARYGVPPRQKVPVRLRARGEAEGRLRAVGDLIGHMAGAEPVEVSREGPRAPDSAVAVVGDVEIQVPGIVDVAAEREKLKAQRDKLRARIRGTEGKLANEGFLAKAPPEVVEREKRLLADLRAQLEGLQANLEALSP